MMMNTVMMTMTIVWRDDKCDTNDIETMAAMYDDDVDDDYDEDDDDDDHKRDHMMMARMAMPMLIIRS